MSASTVVMSQAASSLLTHAYGVAPTGSRSFRTACRTCRSSIRDHQAQARARGPHGHPELRAPRPRQGLRVGHPGDARGREGHPVRAVRHRRRHAPRHAPAGGRGLPAKPRGDGRRRRRHRLVRFVDRFVGRVELGSWLEAADVFVTPYPNLDQIVSGTLSYAMGSGKAIVSTPYAYARERLARAVAPSSPPRRPRPSPMPSPSCSATASGALRRAARYAYSRGMVWSTVGETYNGIFTRAALRSRRSSRPGREARGRRWLTTRSLRSTGVIWPSSRASSGSGSTRRCPRRTTPSATARTTSPVP